MILVIDNYDSFTYNLVQYLCELRAEVAVFRNDEIGVDEIDALQPEGILLSPGPGRPADAGVTMRVIAAFAGRVPILGVCLGHQAIGEHYGGHVVRAERLMHGRTSEIQHGGAGLFAGLPNPLVATRYHSLILDSETLPEVLERTAWTVEGEIMGVRHRIDEVEGVQFHPESFLTQSGHELLEGWLGRLPQGGSRPPSGVTPTFGGAVSGRAS